MVDLHIDTDIGGDIDDLCALAMALGWPGCKVEDITTVHDADGMRAALGQYAVNIAGRIASTWVWKGASLTLSGKPVPDIAQMEKFWGIKTLPDFHHAHDLVTRLEFAADYRDAIAAIGPFTNIAILETLRPGLLAETNLVVMGGWLQHPPDGYPQWGPEMDWNIQSDQVAARLVFEGSDPLVVPLHVSVQTYLTETHIRAVEEYGPLPALVAKQARLYAEHWSNQQLASQYTGIPEGFLNYQHDPLAVAVALGWDGVTIEELPVTPVMQGDNLILAPGGHKPLRVVTTVDAAGLADVWIECLRRIH